MLSPFKSLFFKDHQCFFLHQISKICSPWQSSLIIYCMYYIQRHGTKQKGYFLPQVQPSRKGFCIITSDWIRSKICNSISQLNALYCRKLFDVIYYVTFRWMICGFMWFAMLQFEMKLQKCIRMGITISKIFFWGGISLGLRSEITFYSSARPSP